MRESCGPNRGRLIVFEGVDGTGKTTLCKELCKSLRSNHKIVNLWHFPGNELGTLGGLVYKIHHEHGSEFGVPRIDPCSLQLLHIAAHVDAIESQIKPALYGGEWVILDRFWWSTYVYGLDNGVQESALLLMVNIEKLVWGAIKPDILFLVNSRIPLRNDETDSIAWHRKQEAYNRLWDSESVTENCVRLETGKGDRAKYRAMSQIQESITVLA